METLDEIEDIVMSLEERIEGSIDELKCKLHLLEDFINEYRLCSHCRHRLSNSEGAD